MWIAFLLAAAAVIASMYFAQPHAMRPAAEEALSGMAVQPATPSLVPSPSSWDVSASAAASTPVAAVVRARPSGPVPATPSPKPRAAATAQPVADNDASLAVAGDCDGKEIHLERHNGEDVSVEVDCDKAVEGGGNISNDVTVDARTGGTAGSGEVKVDINIKNMVSAGR